MAKTKSGDSKSKVFKQIYGEHPNLLTVPGYDEVLKKYKELRPGTEITKSLRGIAANVKSIMNSEKGGKKRRRGRPVAAAAGAGHMNTPKISATAHRALEEQIDDCLYHAKRIDPTGLSDVIRYLRHARNMVILHAGE